MGTGPSLSSLSVWLKMLLKCKRINMFMRRSPSGAYFLGQPMIGQP
jgi:hypothetical protein